MGFSPDIIPEDILHSYIETKLNPKKYLLPYTDKNIFQQIIGKKYLPSTLLCRMNGSCILDSEYNVFEFADDLAIKYQNVSAVILKPSVDTSSGKGVIKFTRNNGRFVNSEGHVLNKELLLNYGDNFILQECLSQSDFMSRLCKTSVNTIRVAIYRSVKDESINVLAAILRIGKDGEVVDNAHAGGRFIGINIQDGTLDNKTLDQYGKILKVWNGIDYSSNIFRIPNWDAVIQLSKHVGKCLRHQRLINLDIALNVDNQPILIEYNIKTMGPWLFMLTNQAPLGKFTDEIIGYCKNN